MCPMCSGCAYTLLGILGSLTWCRCRACGWTFELANDGPDADAPPWAEQD